MRELIAGVDEAGRGPLAGSVVVAAVILPDAHTLVGLHDSKLLSALQRERLYPQIIAQALAYHIVSLDREEIDRLNILQATLLGMQRAVAGLAIQPTQVLVDGNQCPSFSCEAKAIVKGDQKIAAISAASILAKVTRDRQMLEYETLYPGYGFATHKGYGTATHRAALERLGPCSIHRRSFAPLREWIHSGQLVDVL